MKKKSLQTIYLIQYNLQFLIRMSILQENHDIRKIKRRRE